MYNEQAATLEPVDESGAEAQKGWSSIAYTNANPTRPGGWGKARRLARLRSQAGVYVWLALDHGLTRGVLEGLADPGPSLALAASSDATGVVVNRGLASLLPERARAGLVLQTFGLPVTGAGRAARVPTCRVEDALRLSADAIAVQLDLNAAGLPEAIRALSSTISDAAAFDLPVLIMMTALEADDEFEAFADALRICTELGADTVKIALPQRVDEASRRELAVVREALERSPPTLLCGGERSDGFAERLALARDLGFSGACVGRHVFQAPNPAAVLETIANAFQTGVAAARSADV